MSSGKESSGAYFYSTCKSSIPLCSGEPLTSRTPSSCASISGLPRILHEVDLDVEEPLDVDDQCLTTSASLRTLPGVRSKMSSFILMCRLTRILSRSLDTLYTTTKRANAKSKIKEMSRMCCEHLLNQWQTTQREHRAQLLHATSEEETFLVTLASLNEGLMYDYLRWLIYRPGLVLQKNSAQFRLSLDICTESAASMIDTAYTNVDALIYIQENPGAQSCSLWLAALTVLYRVWALYDVSKRGTIDNRALRRARRSVSSCLQILRQYTDRDPAVSARANTIESLMQRTFDEALGPSEASSTTTQSDTQMPFEWESSYSVPEDLELDSWSKTIDSAFGDLFSTT